MGVMVVMGGHGSCEGGSWYGHIGERLGRGRESDVWAKGCVPDRPQGREWRVRDRALLGDGGVAVTWESIVRGVSGTQSPTTPPPPLGGGGG